MNRIKLGFMIPSEDTNVEPDAYRITPPEVTSHFARLTVSELPEGAKISVATVREHLRGLANDVERCARLLSTADVNSIAFACTSGSFAMGKGWDEELIRIILKGAPNVKATTTATAVVNALKELKLNNIAIATPYLREFNQIVVEFLEAHGFRVAKIEGLGLSQSLVKRQIGVVTPEEVYKFAKRVYNDVPEVDGIFISCTNFGATKIIEKLECDIGKPVLGANQVTLWDMLKKIGFRGKIENFGGLLKRL